MAATHYKRRAKDREWSTGFWECTSDKESLLLSLFCPWCYVGYQASRRDSTETKQASWVTPCCCLALCPFCWLKKEYRLTRKKYRIQRGEQIWDNDWVRVCCCPFVSLMHMGREIDVRIPPKRKLDKFPKGTMRYESKGLMPPMQVMMTEKEYVEDMDDIIRVKARKRG